MLNTPSPIEDALSEIERDIRTAGDVVDPWHAPTGLCSGLESAAQAITALRQVHAALGDLEPGAALIVTDALARGLGVTR